MKARSKVELETKLDQLSGQYNTIVAARDTNPALAVTDEEESLKLQLATTQKELYIITLDELSRQYDTIVAARDTNPALAVTDEEESLKLQLATTQKDLVSHYRSTLNNQAAINVKILPLVIKLAESGDLDSQRTLCFLYNGTSGVGPDSVELKKWLRKAAENGDRECASELSKQLGNTTDGARWNRLSNIVGQDQKAHSVRNYIYAAFSWLSASNELYQDDYPIELLKLTKKWPIDDIIELKDHINGRTLTTDLLGIERLDRKFLALAMRAEDKDLVKLTPRETRHCRDLLLRLTDYTYQAEDEVKSLKCIEKLLRKKHNEIPVMSKAAHFKQPSCYQEVLLTVTQRLAELSPALEDSNADNVQLSSMPPLKK
jgi:hypothetical protein